MGYPDWHVVIHGLDFEDDCESFALVPHLDNCACLLGVCLNYTTGSFFVFFFFSFFSFFFSFFVYVSQLEARGHNTGGMFAGVTVQPLCRHSHCSFGYWTFPV